MTDREKAFHLEADEMMEEIIIEADWTSPTVTPLAPLDAQGFTPFREEPPTQPAQAEPDLWQIFRQT